MAGRAQPLGTSSSLLLVSQIAHWFGANCQQSSYCHHRHCHHQNTIIICHHRIVTIVIIIIIITITIFSNNSNRTGLFSGCLSNLPSSDQQRKSKVKQELRLKKWLQQRHWCGWRVTWKAKGMGQGINKRQTKSSWERHLLIDSEWKLLTALASALNFTIFDISTPRKPKKATHTPCCSPSGYNPSQKIKDNDKLVCQLLKAPVVLKIQGALRGKTWSKWNFNESYPRFVHGNSMAPHALLMYNSKGNKELWAPPPPTTRGRWAAWNLRNKMKCERNSWPRHVGILLEQWEIQAEWVGLDRTDW